MSDVDLLAANQACMAYAVMGIVDQCPQSAQASPELLSTLGSGLAYDPMQSYRTIPLPGPKLLWEARTRAAFDKEFSAGGVLRSSGLISLGDLMDAQQSSHLADSAQKLDRWNASVDNLGLLLGLVGPMLT
ncbi:hypothetical protein ANO11243_093410 [Dothideomycetidae sp. 11243]|nr:hypothetical protein ANO11243_093410 [fungal sp. No.11243]